MSNLDLARSDLVGAAMRVTQDTWTDPATVKALCEAATVYADARRVNAHRSPLPMPTTAVFPNYGRSKGLPVAGASVGDLQFYRRGCERTLADESKSRWHEKERALLAAIDAELRQVDAESDSEDADHRDHGDL